MCNCWIRIFSPLFVRTICQNELFGDIYSIFYQFFADSEFFLTIIFPFHFLHATDLIRENRLVFHFAVNVHRKPYIFVRQSAIFIATNIFAKFLNFQYGVMGLKRSQNEDGVHFGYVCSTDKKKKKISRRLKVAFPHWKLFALDIGTSQKIRYAISSIMNRNGSIREKMHRVANVIQWYNLLWPCRYAIQSSNIFSLDVQCFWHRIDSQIRSMGRIKKKHMRNVWTPKRTRRFIKKENSGKKSHSRFSLVNFRTQLNHVENRN